MPNAGIRVEAGAFQDEPGGRFNRRLTVTPTAGQRGQATMARTVTDGVGLSRPRSFTLTSQEVAPAGDGGPVHAASPPPLVWPSPKAETGARSMPEAASETRRPV